MSKEIYIINFPFSNSLSIFNALRFLGYKPLLVKNSENLIKAKNLIIPWVGTFKSAISFLKKKKFDKIIINKINNGDKVFCICLGMQILFEKGFEIETTDGLGIFKGSVKKLPKINLGWRQVYQKGKPTYSAYFVHSYYVDNKDKELISTSTFSNNFEFCSGFKKNNVFATQFHPEKSGKIGLDIIKNFFK